MFIWLMRMGTSGLAHQVIHASVAMQPLLGPWPLFQFLDLLHSLLGRGSAATYTQTSMPRVGIEPTTPVFERRRQFMPSDSPDQYSGDVEFVTFIRSFGEILVWYLKLCHGHFLPHPCQLFTSNLLPFDTLYPELLSESLRAKVKMPLCLIKHRAFKT
jgi:hypothetical protein